MPPDIVLVPASAFATPPSQSGARIRLWDRDFNLIADNAAADIPAAKFLTVDTDAGRTGFRLEPI